ncbi:Peroxisomal membrane protein 11-3 [Hibiscus syriacus]|uniref:Peroxisomal membrane protein 11-3 n=1 Tax=Hibiscus syriacus TaxID=106335 RepID=A0A6A2WDS8_HIBSY|nr:Peroxisomal membrane protein 11-3 [Hibiscus syriacus]
MAHVPILTVIARFGLLKLTAPKALVRRRFTTQNQNSSLPLTGCRLPHSPPSDCLLSLNRHGFESFHRCPSQSQSKPKEKDFLNHIETYLAKRDGVDKLLKISRYATKIILASSLLPEAVPLSRQLKSFESSVGLSRKAFRLGKFVQDVNALRNSHLDSKEEILLSIIAYGGEGLYYFIEQFVWLAKSGLIDPQFTKDQCLGRVYWVHREYYH